MGGCGSCNESLSRCTRRYNLPPVARGAVLDIGVGHSGVIDTEKGLVLSYPRPGQMASGRIKGICEQEFGLPCVIEDSVRTMTTAEQSFGLGRDVDDFLYIEVGMGIGAAIFFEGKLYRGAEGKAGEFGHITVDEDGTLCSCGNNGCLESVASCAAISKRCGWPWNGEWI